MFFNTSAAPKTKDGIAKFLSGHPRYQTNSGVHPLTSYSHCVKLHRLGLNRSESEKAASIMQSDDYWRELRGCLRGFQDDMQGRYQISPMGRNSGHLVLFEAEVYDPGYKSTCRQCGHLSHQLVSPQSSHCGECGGLRSNLKKPLSWSRVIGSGIDHGVTYRDSVLSAFASRLRGSHSIDPERSARSSTQRQPARWDGCCAIWRSI